MRLRTTVYGLVLCLLLAGCGLPRGTRPVIKVGLVAPFEGRYRSLGYEALHAVKLAVRERNVAGGVAGHMVELVALDDGDTPDASSVQARKLGVDERVMGVVGPFSEAAARAAAPVYREFGLAAIPPVSCASIPQSSSGDPALSCLGADRDALSRALVERLPANARVTLLRAGPEALGDDLRRAAGWVLEAPWDATAFAAMRERPADVYLFDGDVLNAADFLIAARQAEVGAPLWGGPALARTQLAQIAGDAVVGACHALTAPVLGDLTPGSAFVAAYRELSGAAPGPWAALAYDAAHLLLDAIERAIKTSGAPTREGVLTALVETRGPDEQLVFDRGRRREAEVVFYCYEPGDAYPGTMRH